MGIPSYFKYITSNYNTIFRKRKHVKQVHNLYIDSNSIIYDSIRLLDMSTYKRDDMERFEMDLIKKVFEKIKEYIDIVKPSKCVYIAIDGVVPFAKMEHQRHRRYKSWFLKKQEKIIEKRFYEQLKERIPDIDDSDTNKVFKWDQTAITPGTEFMKQLDIYLKSKLAEFGNIKKNLNLNIIFSGSSEIGEGEHKIFEYIRNNNHINDYTCVYGLDSDLIMLSLNHLHHCKNIYLIREKTEFNSELDDMYEDNELMYLDVDYLSEDIVKNMISVKKTNDTSYFSHKTNKIHDYIFISFLLGNDFMPHFPSLNIRIDGIDVLFNHYKKCFNDKTTIMKNGKIKWGQFRKLIKSLCDNERNLIHDNTQKMVVEQKYRLSKNCNDRINKQSMNTLIRKHDVLSINKEKKEYMKQQLFNLNVEPCKERDLEVYIEPEYNDNEGDDKWINRYYDTLFRFDYNEENIKEVCRNYLEGLEWCFAYYTTGCKDYKWRYNFHYPPLFKDLYTHTPMFECDILTNNAEYTLTDYKTYKKTVTPLSLLSYVIPQTAFHLLPKNLSDSLLSSYTFNYTLEHEIIYTYCKYLWEGHVEFPYVDLNEFIEFVRLRENKTL